MNCSFNIRYKPRTTRAFTKSDLTVYDSAGNTALNTLTVYGKSEVVNSKIVSAGEGYGVIDLGTLTWSSGGAIIYFASVPNMKLPTTEAERIVGILCNKYAVSTATNVNDMPDKSMLRYNGNIFIKDSNYTSVSAFAASLGDATICYELADPTQGNAIAVKTDNGSGINGTMATFTTGTPLRGIPNGAKDVTEWAGSSGEVTKNCNVLNMGGLTWNKSDNGRMYSNPIAEIKRPADRNTLPNILNPIYTPDTDYNVANLTTNKTIGIGNDYRIYVYDTDYTDATAFKNAMSGVMLVYELATPTTQPLTSAENASIAALRTFTPQTHAQNNAQTEMTIDYTIRVPSI